MNAAARVMKKTVEDVEHPRLRVLRADLDDLLLSEIDAFFAPSSRCMWAIDLLNRARYGG